MNAFRTVTRGLVAAIILLCAAGLVSAQQAYRTPPQVVVDILDAPPPPATLVSPDRAWLLLADRAAMPTIAEMSQPMLRLAGDRINPATNGPFRALNFTALRLEQVSDGATRVFPTPAGAKIGYPMWSPDGRLVAFTVTGSEGIALWVATVATGQALSLTGPVLNATIGAPCSWMPDATELLCRFVPDGRSAAPVASRVPPGPHV
ncbi:MAG: S9 family peptidase, partial [Gemmatimonadales bacterium]